MHRLKAQQLGHRYGRRVLFKKLSLLASSGESWAITGSNGSGKSTLLKILAGLLRPARGKVILLDNGRPVPIEEHPLRIGLVAPYVNVYDDLTLRENLTFLTRARSMRSTDDKIDKLVGRVGLSGHVDQQLSTYSTGMMQRARIAVALVHQPGVLLLDEPTLSLDGSGRSLCAQIIADVTASGGIAVIASNATSDIALAERAICIEDYTSEHVP